ncbi:DUF2799 domain-containing protein [Pontibacterium granulatum]|uniref:DUF2799 domain-containing protein n=1 Tax=Pontibacterium granulatum TaxID=2036029 RepID=UPI00249CB7D2|nr:DUF2799 domain-containing protein [Pontibacterium granulatum]MDI3322811.1 DUF2799 domain-containing protein [Pontibacterium granulatum]
MNRALGLCLISLGLVGCASISKDSCVAGNWYDIGLRDGANGFSAERRFEHEKSCDKHGVPVQVQVDEYLKGREAGVRLYCTPANGYQLGLQIDYYQDVCPADMKGAFVRAYNLGRQKARLRCLWDFHHHSAYHRYGDHHHHHWWPYYRHSALDCF